MTTDALARLATAHMLRGRDLMALGGPEATRRALTLFDRAIAIRRGLPLDIAAARYDLAGGWLNRAEALMALGDAADLERALGAFDAAMPLLTSLPIPEEPRYARRLAVALQNRAVVRRRLGRDSWKVLTDLYGALEALDSQPDQTLGDTPVLRAAIWTRIADAQLAEADPAAWHRARQSARHALASLDGGDDHELQAAAVALAARQAICEAAARDLARGDLATQHELVHEASDAVDEALALIARWDARGVGTLRDAAPALLEFGRRLYGCYQPHFVEEFERDYAGLA